MDFSLSDDLAELKERTERFVREEILPYENDPRQTAHGLAEELRRGPLSSAGPRDRLRPESICGRGAPAFADVLDRDAPSREWPPDQPGRGAVRICSKLRR
jgi:hypothetical protein